MKDVQVDKYMVHNIRKRIQEKAESLLFNYAMLHLDTDWKLV